MNFAMFIVLNGILLIRPEEMFPLIAGARLYLIVIVACSITSLKELKVFFSAETLSSSPVSVCVLTYFSSTIVSLCVLGRVSEALFEFGPEFAKVILYFCLLVSLVDSESRYRAMIAWLLLFILTISAIALAQQYGYVSFPNIEPVMQRETDPTTGEDYNIPRMVSSGIFNDPNDLCLLLGFGILCCIYATTNGSGSFASKIVWLSPIPVFVFALLETHSRGGLMGVIAGLAGYFYARFGGPKSLLYAAAGVAAVLALVGGRQGNIAGGGTAHERLMYWASGLSYLFSRPTDFFTGIGAGSFSDEFGQVAHNSFVQTYVEEGLFGGTAFVGAFVYSAWMIDRLGRTIDAPPWVVQARPFAFGSICGYAMGCYSLTRNLVIPTYMILGLAAVIVFPRVGELPAFFRVNRGWFVRTLVMGLVGLMGIKLATQLLGAAGV